ncbi:hypothetical protein G3I19_04920 [Streptomyces sp. SID10853]|uniref:hypothetical protein n=1 Tax=Streptomyces sp. SID10853 TaxID=2706028 RepID=UPI0013C05EBE|nr:hypothetical protein [Streptomyces sp. SID10853]NDZ77876.1 hypothetical protein [Streptomyces sp. SID10853]
MTGGPRPRPTERLRRAQQSARPADQVLDPEDLGSARHTRHSFARSFLRVAAAQRWTVTRETWDIDAQGRGEAVYRIDAEGHELRLAVFSTVLPDGQRTDRVVADAWDITAALVEGPWNETRHAELRAQVPGQEKGRADAATLVWTRANRSRRFFDYVVDRLAEGRQPDPAELGDAAYVLRSTAFYSNGKFGLADYGRLPADHPLRLPYRSQMLTAWLLRELSYDLVEHCAAAKSPDAVVLDGDWRCFLGLGNATGLGMVPYVINHPQVLDAWCAVRELPLAYALGRTTSPQDARTARVRLLIDRARAYYRERDTLATAPYLPGPELAGQLDKVAELLAEYLATGSILGHPTDRAWHELHTAAGEIGLEARGVVDSVLVEVHDELDPDIDALLHCDQTLQVTPGQTCGELRSDVLDRYGWVRRFDFDDPGQQAHFWFSSQDNEEPRRGRRGTDPGEEVEHPVDIARAVTALLGDLERADDGRLVGEFLLAHPWHRGAVGRVQSLAGLPYAEVRANLLAEDFLPLHLQRFQLALYGMDNYSPQSTDWLRVTLFSGAPRASDTAAGTDHDWFFVRKPRKEAP